jgi:hypothetical protein
MSQMPEDPKETRSWEDKKRDAEQTAQMNEDPEATSEWEKKKDKGSGEISV